MPIADLNDLGQRNEGVSGRGTWPPPPYSLNNQRNDTRFIINNLERELPTTSVSDGDTFSQDDGPQPGFFSRIFSDDSAVYILKSLIFLLVWGIVFGIIYLISASVAYLAVAFFTFLGLGSPHEVNSMLWAITFSLLLVQFGFFDKVVLEKLSDYFMPEFTPMIMDHETKVFIQRKKEWVLNNRATHIFPPKFQEKMQRASDDDFVMEIREDTLCIKPKRVSLFRWETKQCVKNTYNIKIMKESEFSAATEMGRYEVNSENAATMVEVNQLLNGGDGPAFRERFASF